MFTFCGLGRAGAEAREAAMPTQAVQDTDPVLILGAGGKKIWIDAAGTA
jgi:hypothetical protein